MMVMEAAGAKKPSMMSVKDKADLMLRRVARAGQKLLVYSTPAITNDPILPWTDIPPKPSDVLAVRACRGEYEPASFVAYPIEDDLTVEVSATDLKGPAGAIGSDRVDIRVVKCWYRAGGKIFAAGLASSLGGDSFEVVGGLQDLIVMSYIPLKEDAAKWHSKGHKIMSYANPQSGFEKRETYRRNYGLVLDYANYGGGMMSDR